MARFTAPMERRLGELEREYDVVPGREGEEEGGVFGPRGFFGNIREYYGMDSWGDWWRGLFGREERGRGRRREDYTVSPGWGRENINTLRDIMRED